MRRPSRQSIETFPAPVRDQEIDPWYMFTVLGPQMVAAARHMRKQARHHNGINVGSSMIAAIMEDEHVIDVGLFTGANQNLRKGRNNTKVCAEQVALAKAKKAGFNRLIAMVVSGPPQPDTQSGLTTQTLHTCGEDRELYWENEEARDMVEDDALHVSVDPEQDIFEIYETNELHTAHALPGAIPLEVTEDPGFGVWQKAGPLYLREVDYVLSNGEEPLRPLVAKLAITGHLSLAA